MTSAKLDAARRLGLPVVMVSRPPEPDIPQATTVAEAQRWVRALVRQRG
jgi:precorrin-6A/cobalt-precorrin-6A reductase